MTNAKKDILLDPEVSNVDWIKECVEKLVLPQFVGKNKSYANNTDEWHNIRQMAARNFPAQYATDPWAAMARVCTIVKDKHDVALARSINVPEAQDRLRDCIIYDFFRLRLKMLRDAELQRLNGETNY